MMPTVTPEPEKKPLIDVATAAQSAMNYAIRLFQDVSQFTLEEVELSDDGKYWMITLGYARKKILPAGPLFSWHSPSVLNAEASSHEIDYKVFKVDARTGEVVAMKLRPLQ